MNEENVVWIPNRLLFRYERKMKFCHYDTVVGTGNHFVK